MLARALDGAVPGGCARGGALAAGVQRPRRRGAGGAFKGEFYSVDSSGLFIELFMTLSDLLV